MYEEYRRQTHESIQKVAALTSVYTESNAKELVDVLLADMLRSYISREDDLTSQLVIYQKVSTF
jgi:hypothetical protein